MPPKNKELLVKQKARKASAEEQAEKAFRFKYSMSQATTFAQDIVGKHFESSVDAAIMLGDSLLMDKILEKTVRARFHRKTKRYSKSFSMIIHSLVLLFNKHLIPTVV